MKKAIYFIGVLLLLFCSSSSHDEQSSNYFDSKKSLLIRDTSLLNRVRIKKESVAVLDTNYQEVSQIKFKDTFLLKILRDEYLFKDIIQILSNEQQRDSILAENVLTLKKRLQKPRRWKIAIDPGHMAGSMEEAKFEDKFIEIDDKTFYEARLTYFTSVAIKEQLEKRGLDVKVFRENGESSYPMNYEAWYQNHFFHTLDSMISTGSIEQKSRERLVELYNGGSDYGKKVLFHRMYKQIDLRYRANQINRYKPDLTLVIHYNVDAKNKDWTHPTNRNYTMAFVPGSFMEGELDHEEDLRHFLRLLMTDDLKQSVAFSEEIMKSFHQRMDLTIAPDTTVEEYLTKYCLPSGVEGVFARNLTMTRLVEGAICYGETLYQDNVQEIIELSKNDCEIKGEKISCKVKQIAETYAVAVLNYIENNPK